VGTGWTSKRLSERTQGAGHGSPRGEGGRSCQKTAAEGMRCSKSALPRNLLRAPVHTKVLVPTCTLLCALWDAPDDAGALSTGAPPPGMAMRIHPFRRARCAILVGGTEARQGPTMRASAPTRAS
jgi:hypothetical protein